MKTARDINGKIIITIDTSGYVVNSAIDANLTKAEITKINYYLSHITKLIPLNNDGIKTLANISIELKTVLTTSENKTNCLYEVFNLDSVDYNNVAEQLTKVGGNISSVQIEAKFPGNQYGWAKYLEKNLNLQVPSDKGAPPGNYTVTLSFLVDTTGKVSDVQALNDPGYGTAEEAVRVIKNGPNWKSCN